MAGSTWSKADKPIDSIDDFDTSEMFRIHNQRVDNQEMALGAIFEKPEGRTVSTLGGGTVRAFTLPADGTERKKFPVASGVMDYFPDAIVAVSNVSHVGNEQHNPGQPLHWNRSKSTDEADTMMRHFLQRGTRDSDGVRHSAKMAWRALALLQKEIENDGNSD